MHDGRVRPRRLPAHLDDDGFDAFVHAEHGRLLAVALALTGDRVAAVAIVDGVLADLLRSWDPSADTSAVSVAARRLLIDRLCVVSVIQQPRPADPALRGAPRR